MGSREQHALGSQRTKVGRLSGDDAPVIGAEVEPTDVAPMMTTLSGFFSSARAGSAKLANDARNGLANKKTA